MAASFGVVLSAAYLLRMFGRVALGPVEQPENRGLIDLDWRERGVLLALLVPVFWIGLHPETLTSRLHQPVLNLLRTVHGRTEAIERVHPDPHNAALLEELARVAVRPDGSVAWAEPQR